MVKQKLEAVIGLGGNFMWRQCNGVCVYVHLQIWTYRFQIEINYTLLSSCTEFNCRGANATGWRQYMETLPALLVRCEGNSLFASGFPTRRDSDTVIWCLLWFQPERNAHETLGKQVNCCGLTLIWTHCNEKFCNGYFYQIGIQSWQCFWRKFKCMEFKFASLNAWTYRRNTP